MPIGWWWHKIWCEVGYAIRKITRSERMYYNHLDQLCEYGFNLYGEKINIPSKYKWFVGSEFLDKWNEINPPMNGSAAFTGNAKK